MQPVFSVSELNHRTKDLLENSFPLMWVSGEISNLKRYDSGHWYFSLKDAGAQVRCVMFRHKNQYMNWQPMEGSQVEVRALVTLYEARGEFQLTVEAMRHAGSGSLFKAFEALKAKLAGEGLFDPLHKQILPRYPRQIGIITSPAAAALQDVLSVLQHRMPALPVILYPVPVQGEGAAASIAAAIETAARRAECDVLILCRGGGSIEDLWAFNEESVARAIYLCPIPLITGIGHETDFTIADFVADIRAPTPTGAAQLACPDQTALLHHLASLRDRMLMTAQRTIESRMQKTDMLAYRLIHPGEYILKQSSRLQVLHEKLVRARLWQIDNHQWRLRETARRMIAARPDIAKHCGYQDQLVSRLNQAVSRYIDKLEMNLHRQYLHLVHLDPQQVLERGYSIVHDRTGKIVSHSNQTDVGNTVRITFARGWSEAIISEKNNPPEDGCVDIPSPVVQTGRF